MFKNSKILLIIVSLVTLALLGGLVLIVYNIRVKNREASELINTADRIAEATVLTKSVETIRTDAGADLAALEAMTLSSEKLILLIENIEGVGRALKLGVKISSVDRVEDKENKKSTEPPVFRIMLDTEGPWLPNFVFLQALESLPYRVMMEEISLSRAEVGWQARIVLSIPTVD